MEAYCICHPEITWKGASRPPNTCTNFMQWAMLCITDLLFQMTRFLSSFGPDFQYQRSHTYTRTSHKHTMAPICFKHGLCSLWHCCLVSELRSIFIRTLHCTIFNSSIYKLANLSCNLHLKHLTCKALYYVHCRCENACHCSGISSVIDSRLNLI